MNRTLRLLVLPAVLVLGLAGWAGYQYFIVADSPDAVSTDAALEQLTQDLSAEQSAADDAPQDDEAEQQQAATDSGDEQSTADEYSDEEAPAVVATPTTEAAPADVEDDVSTLAETWVVDDDFGDFAFENASGSFAGFRVDKELFVGGQQVAVGRSGNVTGSLAIGDGAVLGGEIVVDTTALQSDIGAREGAIADAVRSSEIPTASFVIADPAALDTAALEAGETVSTNITGELTIAGATATTTVAVEATIVDSGIGLIVGTAELTWADFNVVTPDSSSGTVAPQGTLEFQLIVRAS